MNHTLFALPFLGQATLIEYGKTIGTKDAGNVYLNLIDRRETSTYGFMPLVIKTNQRTSWMLMSFHTNAQGSRARETLLKITSKICVPIIVTFIAI